MKRIIFVIVVLFFIMDITGCSSKSKSNEKNNELSNAVSPTESVTDNQNITPKALPTLTVTAAPTTAVTAVPSITGTPAAGNNKPLTIADYYPFIENIKYEYTGEGNEYAAYTVFTDYIEDGRAQFRINNGGSELVKVLENKNGAITMLMSRGETYYRENLLNKPQGKKEILLKEPLVKGTEWKLSDKKKRYISNVDVDIITPAGSFKTIEVTTEGNSASEKTIDYYAKDVGLIKSVFKSGDTEVTSTLNKVTVNAPFTQTIVFYYPNVDSNKIYAVEKQITFKTNDVTRKKIETAVKELLSNKYDQVLSKNVKINSLYLNNSNIVFVDFSKEFITDMNAGSGYEAMILQCITNTLGNYYNTDQVYITIEGKPYESGHIVMKKGETFKVNYDNVIK